jgi:hypothetical protein
LENFVKALYKNVESFKCLGGRFPTISEAKFKAGISDGPQITKLLKDTAFDTKLNERESPA